MPSKAYKVFQKNLEQVGRLSATYDSELSKNRKRGKRGLDHLTRAGLVFLCSSFEIYFESVLEESCQIVAKTLRTPNELPKQVRKTISKHVKENNNELSPTIFASDWKKYYLDMVLEDVRKLNTPKIHNMSGLLAKYLGLNDVIDRNSYPFLGIDDIVSERGAIAHKLYGEKYLKKSIFLEYEDTIRDAVKGLEMILYVELPKIIKKKPWNNTY